MSKEKTTAELLRQYNKGKKRQMTPEQIRRAVTNRDWTFEGASEERNAIARRVKQAIGDAKLLLQSGKLTETQKKDLQDAFKPVDDGAIVGPILGNKEKMSQLVNLEGSILLLKMTPEQIRRAVTNRDWTFEGASEEWNALAKRLKQAIDDAELLLGLDEVTRKQKEALQKALEVVKIFARISLPIGNKKKMSQLKALEKLIKEIYEMPSQATKKRDSVAVYQPDPKKQCVLKL